MRISFKQDHGLAKDTLMGLNSFEGHSGGMSISPGAAIGSAAALIIGIGKEWNKNDPVHIPYPEEIPSGPPANDTPGTPSIPGTPSVPGNPSAPGIKENHWGLDNIWNPNLDWIFGNNLPGETIPDVPGIKENHWGLGNIWNPNLDWIFGNNLPGETIPDAPESDVIGTPIPDAPESDVIGTPIPDAPESDVIGTPIPDAPESDLPGLTHNFDLSGNKTWESYWQEGIKMGQERFGGFAPNITQEDINKGIPIWKIGEDGKLYINIKEETSAPSTGDGEPEIKPEEEKVEDKTFENIENAITPFDPLKWAEEQQIKMWEREDNIRLETQQREDTAYQRAIEDMQRAGINPNLMGSITPAGSGGGITNATPADTALAQKQMEKDMELLKQAIDNAFKGEQNQKDRIWSLIEKVLGAGAMLGSAAIR